MSRSDKEADQQTSPRDNPRVLYRLRICIVVYSLIITKKFVVFKIFAQLADFQRVWQSAFKIAAKILYNKVTTFFENVV